MNHPRTVHRIWVGPNQPPERFAHFEDLWHETHPGWTVENWTDPQASTYPALLRDEYDRAPTWVHRKDILCLEIVCREGGLFADWDMEPLRNLEPLIKDSEAWCTPDADGFPGGALFGAVPNHGVLVDLIEGVRARVADGWSSPNIDTGPWLWHQVFGGWRITETHDPGAAAVTANGNQMDVLGNQATAYPIHYAQRDLLRSSTRDELRNALAESYAVHHFAASWLNGGADVA